MQARSLFWGSLSAQWVAKALVALLSIGLTVLLGRRLGPAVFGDFSFLMAAGGLWVLLQDGGYATLLFREGIKGSQDLAGHDLDLLHRHATGNVLAASLLGAVLAVTLLSDMRLCGVLMVAMFAGSALATFVSSRMRAEGAFKAEALWSLAVRGATALITGAAILFRPTALTAVMAWAAGIWAVLLAAPRPAFVLPAFSRAGRLLCACMPLLTIEAATAIYFRSDVVMLHLLGVSAEDIGQYAAAYKVLEGAGMFLAPLSQIWFRDLRIAWPDRDVLRDTLSRKLRIMFGLLTVALAISLVAGPPAIRLVFGEQYTPAANIFTLLALALAGIMPGAVLTQAALAMNLETAYARAAVLAAVLNVLLNLALVPFLGTVGAALATVATELTLTLMVWVAVRRATGSAS